ncbi:TPA: SGNH/GDSL hydrolase family protein, partial [Klebsiella quasipneumoniae]|nr:SGNH/GDSL hydrolase family protein [Klebsiella quasipneumoniae]
MSISDTQQAAQFSADAAVSAAEAKQYLLEAQQGYQDTSEAAQEAKNAAESASSSEQNAATSEANASQSATEASAARDEAVVAASTASEFGDNKFTFYKTSSDPDGTIAGLAATTNGQSFRVAQGVDGTDAFITYQNDNGVAVAQAAQPGTSAVISTIRQFPTLTAAQKDAAAGNILDGARCWVVSIEDTSLADEYINNGGTLEPTGRKMPSQGYVDVTISESIDKNDDSNLSKSITSDGITTELETESGEKFFSGMNESLQ